MGYEEYAEEDNLEFLGSVEGREDAVDNDEIDPREEAFLRGVEEDQVETDAKPVEDRHYEDAFEKKKRRSKRSRESFDEADIEADVLMQ